MKVLITGAGGQLGQALCRGAPAGTTVIAQSRQQLDIADPNAVRDALQALQPQLIINTAAYTAVDRAEAEPGLARRINADGPAVLASAAVQMGARLLHVSTDYVFAGDASMPYTPDDAPAPLGVYGRTKLEGERAVLERLPGLGTVLRVSWLYGPRGQNFLLTMLRLMKERGAVRVVADQIGCPTSTASAAEALWALAARPQLAGIFHWSEAGVASWYDFAVAIAEEAATRALLPPDLSVTPITTAEYPTPARRPRFSLLDSRRTHEVLDLHPAHWRSGLRKALSELSHV